MTTPKTKDELIAWLVSSGAHIGELHAACEAMKADAREQGRREGLEEAALLAESYAVDLEQQALSRFMEGQAEALRDIAPDIRKLAEKSGGGDV